MARLVRRVDDHPPGDWREVLLLATLIATITSVETRRPHHWLRCFSATLTVAPCFTGPYPSSCQCVFLYVLLIARFTHDSAVSREARASLDQAGRGPADRRVLWGCRRRR